MRVTCQQCLYASADKDTVDELIEAVKKDGGKVEPAPLGYFVYCPNGHRAQLGAVKEQHDRPNS